MEQTLKKYVLPEQADREWIARLVLSLVFPAVIIFCKPIGLTLGQSRVVAAVLLAIIWWSTGIVKKIPASIFLIAVFCLVSGVPSQVIFSFPLSETFPMIVITYLFSQGIANSGLIYKIFQPLLMRLVHTPHSMSGRNHSHVLSDYVCNPAAIGKSDYCGSYVSPIPGADKFAGADPVSPDVWGVFAVCGH